MRASPNSSSWRPEGRARVPRLTILGLLADQTSAAPVTGLQNHQLHVWVLSKDGVGSCDTGHASANYYNVRIVIGLEVPALDRQARADEQRREEEQTTHHVAQG